jgi:hypothetical protein
VYPISQVPEGEDEASFARHNRSLKAEYKKTKPNQAVVSELMKLSYEMRRNDITKEGKPLGELLAQYPFLGTSEEVCMCIAGGTYTTRLFKMCF